MSFVVHDSKSGEVRAQTKERRRKSADERAQTKERRLKESK